MKKLIAAVLLGLSVSPVFANGVYETVSASRISDANAVSVPAEFDYSPLYRQVSGEFKGEKGMTNSGTRFTYTPLYLKVIGDMS